MFYERKTKDQNPFSFILYPLSVFLIFFGIAQTAGFDPAFYTLGVLYFIQSAWPFLTFWRTRNAGFLALGVFQFFVGLVCFSAPYAISNKNDPFGQPKTEMARAGDLRVGSHAN